ncbi:hypothetical protein FOZ61_001023 [Perkinsus olseni]|uniref:tRNA/rRNA methyltransferase SpoU type domain-containing protein n=1 Tax=Perkinsus olseni TaxID=32597 RepID=A0A7J6LYI8_PEROL|nr:hypothetical protein FOZ61_001023 [Perkinsus olseni]
MLQRQRILRASRLNSVIDFVASGGRASAKAHTLVMLDGVQYPGNVARVLRYSSSFGAGALILGEGAVTEDLLQLALNYSHYSTLSGPRIFTTTDPIELIDALRKDHDFVVCALENKEEAISRGVCTMLQWIDLTAASSDSCYLRSSHLLMVAGGEADGVSDAVLGVADAVLSIPTAEGTHHSFNVSYALAIALFERYKHTSTWTNSCRVNVTRGHDNAASTI